METPILTPRQRKSAFIKLGEFLRNPDEGLETAIQSAQNTNAWFTPPEVAKGILAIGDMLSETALNDWFNQFEGKLVNPAGKRVGLILAGNIPMVGFHDIVCVLAAGHTALIKLSSQDPKLIPYVLKKLVELEPDFSAHIQFVERLEDFDAVIATGSNNSSRYFDYYFSKVPHIIRKNRNSVAVLSGAETSDQLLALGSDIFSFFGLGCRNVSKLYVPLEYQFDHFFESIQSLEDIGNHHKYNNNYDYNKSILLVNRVEHLDNGFLLLREDNALASPLAVLHYERYATDTELEAKLAASQDDLQCIVSDKQLNIRVQNINFGESQKPALWDYADGVDTMHFLTSL